MLESVVEAITSVEGAAWKDSDSRSGESEGTVRAALLRIEQQRASLTDEESAENPIVATIYGQGGINRYKVRLNGEVLFSGFHNRQSVGGGRSLEKAQAAGFTVYE